MAISSVLADSSYYLALLRDGRDPIRALALTAATHDLVICGVVRCEVGRGLRHPQTLRRFHAFWDVMLNVPTDHGLWEQAKRTLWQLDRQGCVLPLTDVVIACCASRVGAVVLTFDSHFASIPGVRAVQQLDI